MAADRNVTPAHPKHGIKERKVLKESRDDGGMVIMIQRRCVMQRCDAGNAVNGNM